MATEVLDLTSDPSPEVATNISIANGRLIEPKQPIEVPQRVTNQSADFAQTLADAASDPNTKAQFVEAFDALPPETKEKILDVMEETLERHVRDNPEQSNAISTFEREDTDQDPDTGRIKESQAIKADRPDASLQATPPPVSSRAPNAADHGETPENVKPQEEAPIKAVRTDGMEDEKAAKAGVRPGQDGANEIYGDGGDPTLNKKQEVKLDTGKAKTRETGRAAVVERQKAATNVETQRQVAAERATPDRSSERSGGQESNARREIANKPRALETYGR
jgi:hypothetical protein